MDHKKIAKLAAAKKERVHKKQSAEKAAVEKLETKVTDKFSHNEHMSKLCSSPHSDEVSREISEALQKYKLPPKAHEAALEKEKMANSIRGTLEVLQRLSGLDDAHSIYNLNQEAFKLMKLSKQFEQITPIIEEGQIGAH